MAEADEVRTYYVQIDYIDAQGVEHARGASVKYPKDDREGPELLRRGVLSAKPVRKDSGRVRKGDAE